MTTFVVRDRYNGVLISLQALLDRLPQLNGQSYRLHNFRLHYGSPMGMEAVEFEARTTMPGGLHLSADQFRLFATGDFQIIDGQIDVTMVPSDAGSIVTLECIDASQWEISTQSELLASQLEHSGLTRE